jgi:dTDP-glucose pyrophosphorylase
MTYRACILDVGQTIRDALHSLQISGLEMVLAVKAGDILAGVMTDGDIRRALLQGSSLESPLEPHLNRNYTAASPEMDRAVVLDLMQARQISQIPILDGAGRLVGLHTLHDILGAAQRPNWAVIMAGGRGERLRPITESLPKPMVKVAGRPILERIILHLVGFGIRKVFLSVNYLSEVIESHFGDGRSFGCAIEYLREEKPLGTGGALSLLPQRPAHPLLVLNGDLITQADVGAMLAFHAAGEFVATIGYHQYVHTIPYGVLDLDGARLLGMREKPSESWTTNAGVYVLAPYLLERVPADTAFPLPALVEECLDRREPVGAFQIQDEWIDIGHHRELRRARGEAETT